MARPYKTSPEELLASIDNYLQTCGRENTSLPTRYGFAKFCGISHDALDDYIRISPELGVAIKRVDEEQKAQLMDDGMYGGKEVNSSMAIFLLKANHGLKETSVNEVVGKDGSPFQIQVLNHEINVPGYFSTSTASNSSDSERQAQIQDSSVAPKSEKDNDSTN